MYSVVVIRFSLVFNEAEYVLYVYWGIICPPVNFLFTYICPFLLFLIDLFESFINERFNSFSGSMQIFFFLSVCL